MHSSLEPKLLTGWRWLSQGHLQNLVGNNHVSLSRNVGQSFFRRYFWLLTLWFKVSRLFLLRCTLRLTGGSTSNTDGIKSQSGKRWLESWEGATPNLQPCLHTVFSYLFPSTSPDFSRLPKVPHLNSKLHVSHGDVVDPGENKSKRRAGWIEETNWLPLPFWKSRWNIVPIYPGNLRVPPRKPPPPGNSRPY